MAEYPPTLPANTLLGRLGINPGPAEAVPFTGIFASFGIFPTLTTDKAIVRWSGVAGAAVQNSVVVVDDTGNVSGLGYLELGEIATPASPAANKLRLYAKDVAGITRPTVIDNAGTETDLIGPLTNIRLAKTANYTLVNADKGKTAALGGTAFFTLTVGAASGFDADFAAIIVNEDATRGKTIAINGYSNFILWPGQTIILFNQNSAWKFNQPGRWKIPAAQSWQCNHASGSNTSDGLATGAGAFATLQFAVNVLLAQIDPNGFEVKIVNAAETFTESVIAHGRLPAANLGNDGQDIVIEGDPTTPANCVWQTAGVALTSISSSVKVNGFKLVGTGSGNQGFFAEKNGFIHFFNMNFGLFTAGSHIVVTEGGHCYFDGGTYTITANMATHITVQGTGDVILIAPPMTLPNALTFTDFVDLLGPGWVQFAGGSITGTGSGAGSTGRKYNVRGNGVQSLAGLTLPGATAGVTATGGQAL